MLSFSELMKLVVIVGFGVALLSGSALGAAPQLSIVPWPSSFQRENGDLHLTADSRIVAGDTALEPLAKVLSDEIDLLTGLQLKTVTAEDKPRGGDIFLSIDPTFKLESYGINVNTTATIRGGNYGAAAWGTSTLLQCIEVKGDAVSIAGVTIRDFPGTPFRSVMLDLARRWHPIGTLKETITMLSLYKIRYLHLHLSDDQSCVYSSKAFPQMATEGRCYSPEEMANLVRFADERGVTLIPEIDVPGHCGSWVGKLPEVFGSTNAAGEAHNVGIVNMASEKAYDGMEKLVAELCETFKSSPYIHIGADETGADALEKLPEYQPYCKAHGLKLAAAGQSSELFAHFVVRMTDIIKKHGRKTLVWNGFPAEGTADVKVPRDDLIIDAWTGSPVELARMNYQLVNCAWIPLYIVPTQGRAPGADWLYQWNAHEAGEWGNPRWAQIPLSANLLGAQICCWEQRYNEVVPLLRSRVSAFSERLWSPSAPRPFAEYSAREKGTDQILERLIHPVSIDVVGLTDPDDDTFDKKVTITLKSSVPGTIRVAMEKPWETFPTGDSPAYSQPIDLDDTMTVSAQLFNADGNAVGEVTQRRFSKIVPAYHYRVVGPAPQPMWDKLPNFAALKVLRTGVIGLLTPDRGEQINRSMFAGVELDGHIDVRVKDLYNPYAIELTGRIKIPTDGSYAIKMRSATGQSLLEIGEKGSAGKILASGGEATGNVTLKAGVYPITIEHYWRDVTNDLNIKVQGPGMNGFEAFEKLVMAIGE